MTQSSTGTVMDSIWHESDNRPPQCIPCVSATEFKNCLNACTSVKRTELPGILFSLNHTIITLLVHGRAEWQEYKNGTDVNSCDISQQM